MKKTFKVGYIEYPETTLIYQSININVEDYPELDGMTDDEIRKYIVDNAGKMKPTNDKYYDSLYEELADQDIIREKTPHIGSEVWAEPTDEDDDDNDNDDENDEDDE